MKTVDNAIALRIIYLLTKPFTDWKAYKEGIIDGNGRVIKKANSDNWTMLHRLCARLKMILATIPGGGSRLATAIAAYMLVKENLNTTDENLITESTLTSKTINLSSFDEYNRLLLMVEDGEPVVGTPPANSIKNIGGIKPGDVAPGRLRKKRVKDGKAMELLQGSEGRRMFS
jgi:hypothetical protein